MAEIGYKTEACLHEIFRLIGTPSFIDLFVDFYHELEVTKLWYRSNREDTHTHSQPSSEKALPVVHADKSGGSQN